MLSADDASFSQTPQGQLRIDLRDAAFARADIVFIDPSNHQVSGLIGDVHFAIGILSETMAASITGRDYVILTAPHPQGHDLILTAPFLTIQ